MAAPASAVELALRAVRDAVSAFAAASPSLEIPLRIAVAFSGGRDSMALLDALALAAPDMRVSISAAHVHHGLSPHAAEWAAFCAGECAKRGIDLTLHRVRVERAGGTSLEAAARAARYAALAAVDADAIALAHHADDQAETVLLQLMRGAGARGLAAMPAYRRAASGPALLRPFLALPRTAIDAYAAERGLAWVDDESNANTAVKRNYLRHEIAGRLARAFPGYPVAVARAATHLAEAARLADELALIDAEGAVESDSAFGISLERARLIELAARAPHRARNLLRWFLQRNGLRPPSSARLAEMLRQLTRAKSDARVKISHAGSELGVHRGRIIVHASAVPSFAIVWNGEQSLPLPHGTIELVSSIGSGITKGVFRAGRVTVRNRAGGERIQLAADRPRQALKGLLQSAGVPLWKRDSLPLLFCDDALACVPDIGVDAAFQAAAGEPGYTVAWHPRIPEQAKDP